MCSCLRMVFICVHYLCVFINSGDSIVSFTFYILTTHFKKTNKHVEYNLINKLVSSIKVSYVEPNLIALRTFLQTRQINEVYTSVARGGGGGGRRGEMLFRSFVGTFGNLSVHVSRQSCHLYRQSISSTDKIMK